MAYNNFYPTPLDRHVHPNYKLFPDRLKLPEIIKTSTRPIIDSSPESHSEFSCSSYYQYKGNDGRTQFPILTSEPPSLRIRRSFDDLPASAFVSGEGTLAEVRLPEIQNSLPFLSSSSSMTESSVESDRSVSSSSSSSSSTSSSQIGSCTTRARDSNTPPISSFTRRYNSAPLNHSYHRSPMVTPVYHDSMTSPPSSPLSSKSDINKGCTKCSKTFSRARDLQRHIRSVHRVQKMNMCEFCKCCFTRMDSLLRHQRNKTCNNINARSMPAIPDSLYRKDAVMHHPSLSI